MLRLTLRPTKQQVVKLFHFSKDHDETNHTRADVTIAVFYDYYRKVL
jgi:hypothetical protein